MVTTAVQTLSQQQATAAISDLNRETLIAANGGTIGRSSAQSLAKDFSTFLTILTTQLQNQNPLEPMDSNQFTQQLVQFTEVEQSIKQNSLTEEMIGLLSQSSTSYAVNYIGKYVEAEGVQTELKDGEAKWLLNVPASAEKATITIRDENGNIVKKEQTPLKSGTTEYTWDGDGDSSIFESGKFSIAIEASDSNGIPLLVTTKVTGRVTAVDLTSQEPILTVNGNPVRLSTVEKVSES